MAGFLHLLPIYCWSNLKYFSIFYVDLIFDVFLNTSLLITFTPGCRKVLVFVDLQRVLFPSMYFIWFWIVSLTVANQTRWILYFSLFAIVLLSQSFSSSEDLHFHCVGFRTFIVNELYGDHALFEQFKRSVLDSSASSVCNSRPARLYKYCHQ